MNRDDELLMESKRIKRVRKTVAPIRPQKFGMVALGETPAEYEAASKHCPVRARLENNYGTSKYDPTKKRSDQFCGVLKR